MFNIYRISPRDSKKKFNIQDANHTHELVAAKAIEKIYGRPQLKSLIQTYTRAEISNDLVIADMYRNNPVEVSKTTSPSYQEALSYISKMTKPTKPFLTVHFTGIRMYDLNKSSSAELPYVNQNEFKNVVNKRFEAGEISNKRLSKGNGWNYILVKERVRIHKIKDAEYSNQAMSYDIRMHARSHLTKTVNGPKIRAVYGVPMTPLISEIMLLWPLMNHLKKSESLIAWGYETFNGGLLRLRDEVSSYDFHLSLDFSTFDKRLPFWLFDDIHDMWYSFSNIGPYYDDDPDYESSSTDPVRINRIWEFMRYYVKHSVYRAPDGSRYKRRHSGLPSGLLQTQLLGSYCNAVMVISALFDAGLTENDFHVKVMGDDGLYSIRHCPLSPQALLDHISAYTSKHFNAIINTDKSIISVGPNNIQFLSYKFKFGAVCRVNDDLLGKLLFPESGDFSRDITKSRALGILISNLGYDPLVHAVCLDMLKFLDEFEYGEIRDWYDKQKLSHVLDKPTIPSRQELYALARTCVVRDKITNFDKFLRYPKA